MNKKEADKIVSDFKKGFVSDALGNKTHPGVVFQGLDMLEVYLDVDDVSKLWRSFEDYAGWLFGVDDGSGVSKTVHIAVAGKPFPFNVKQVYPKDYKVAYIFEMLEIRYDELGQPVPVNVDAFAIAIGNKYTSDFDSDGFKVHKPLIETSSKLTIYGSFFARWGQSVTKGFIEDHFETKVFSRVKRFDVCCDLAMRKEVIDKYYTRQMSSHIKHDKEMGTAQTSYMGSRKGGLLLRVYNKVLDTLKREKNHLYEYLSTSPDWTRLEIEIDQSQYGYKDFSTGEKIRKDWPKDKDGKDHVLYWETVFDMRLLNLFYMSFVQSRNTIFLKLGISSVADFPRVRRELFDLETYYLSYGRQFPSHYKSQALGYVKKIFSVGGAEAIADLFSFFDSRAKFSMFSRLFEHDFKVDDDGASGKGARLYLADYVNALRMLSSLAKLFRQAMKNGNREAVTSMHYSLSICLDKISKIDRATPTQNSPIDKAIRASKIKARFLRK